MVDAQKGISDGLVGRAPDTQTPMGGGGARGITQVNDEPYRANQIIPGTGDSPDSHADGSMDSYSMFEQDLMEVDQALESTFDEVEGVLGMARQQWLDLGRRCYDVGRTFYRQGYQTQHLNGSYLFKNRHEPGSKY